MLEAKFKKIYLHLFSFDPHEVGRSSIKGNVLKSFDSLSQNFTHCLIPIKSNNKNVLIDTLKINNNNQNRKRSITKQSFF